MIHRQTPGAPRPPLPQRSLSGSLSQTQHGFNRPNLPSKLSAVQSASVSGSNVVDLTGDGTGRARNAAAYRENQKPVVGSGTEVNELASEDGEPPAKKTKYSDDRPRSAGEDDTKGDLAGLAHKQMLGSPLPTSRPHVAVRRARKHGAGLDMANRADRRANGIEPPAVATRLPPPMDVADFYPWTGKHPEDTLNENVIKTGYSDRAVSSGTQSESNTARTTLWPNLSQKSNMGLGTLSHLFCSVLERRQQLGRCTVPSTFKPPPRVTVTDTKREAWLKDLANSEVPLRKMSRTIPHGIRGKFLLEQCVSKSVPLRRAVWLAKCVGANELRAFRRKGVSGSAAASGEQKWIREWTVSVEQFIEGVVASCGSENWQEKMSYAIKIVNHLYTEKLLDSEHYPDWILGAFRDAVLDRLPVWIILVQIHWKSFVSCGRRGRKLATATLAHLHTLTQQDLTTNRSLTVRLQRLIAVLAVTRRGCLILPQVWDQYKYLLTPRVASVDVESAARNIAKRNERLVSPIRRTGANMKTALLDLYNLLDKVDLVVDIHDLSERCLLNLPDATKLVAALLDWASSMYREGLARIYLTARLIEHLHQTGVDTDGAILSYLAESGRPAAREVRLMYKVVAELSSRGSFSVGRYLQWLISMGASSCAGEGGCDTGLIAALPIDSLPDGILNLRKTLMRRLGHDTEHEQAECLAVVNVVRSLFYNERSVNSKHTGLPTILGSAAKLFAAEILHVAIVSRGREETMSLEAFCAMRDVLEQLEDLTVLAELLETATASSEPAVLSSIADTANLHAESLAAVDSLRALVERLLERHRILRSQQPLDRAFLLSLIDLTSRLTDRRIATKQLQNDLMLCEQQSSLVVCSPASDNMVGMQPGALDTDEDVDLIFASGNVMDEHLMSRVFAKVMDRGGKPIVHTGGLGTASRVCSWLIQLRAVDRAHFEILVRQYLEQACAGAAAPRGFLETLSALVACDVFALRDLLHVPSGPASIVSDVSAQLLQLLTSPALHSAGLNQMETYRLELHCQRFCAFSRAEVVRLIELASRSTKASWDGGAISALLRASLVQDQQLLESIKPSQPLPGPLAEAFAVLVFPKLATTFSEAGALMKPANIVAAVDELSLHFCQFALKQSIRTFPSFGVFESDEPVISALRSAIETRCSMWPQLVEVLDKSRLKLLHAWAVERVLSPKAENTADPVVGIDDKAELYLEVVETTAHSIVDGEQSPAAGAVIEKLQALEKRLNEQCNIVYEQQQAIVKDTCASLHTLLYLALLQQRHSSPEINHDDIALKNRKDLLAILIALLMNRQLQRQQDTLEYLFDAISTLADYLPPESLVSLTSCLPADPRINFLLGSPSSSTITTVDTETGLVLASRLTRSQQAQLPKPQAPATASANVATLSRQWSGALQSRAAATAAQGEVKTAPFALKRWEIIPDPAVNMGENDVSLSLGLFGARKVQ